MEGPEGSMKTHGRAVYHITAIALCTPLGDLERAANDGFSRTGRTPKHHTRAAIIRLLTRHKVGAEPARHAIHLLRLFLIPVSNPEATPNQSGTGYSRYEPSALYFGVLTLWAYIIGRVSDDDNENSQLDEQSFLPEGNLRSSQTINCSSAPQTPLGSLLQGMEVAIYSDDGLACRTYWRSIVPHVAATLALRRNNNAQEYTQVLRSLSDSLSG